MNKACGNHRIKKNLTALLVSLAITYPSQSSAGIPVIDFSSIAQLVKQTAQQARQFAQELQTYANAIKNDIMLSGNQMQADINRSMMEISKITDSENDIYNSKIVRELTPETDAACLLETVSETMREADCFVETEVGDKIADAVSKRLPTAGKEYDTKGNTQQTPSEYKREVYKEMEKVEELGINRGYARADIFNKDVLSDNEAIALDLQIKILQGPPSEKFSSRDFNTEAYKAEFVKRTRQELLKLYAINSLEQQKAIRVRGAGASGESILQSMQFFVDSTIDDEEWIKKVTSSHSDLNKLKTTDQVIRQISSIEAYRARLSLMSFKQLERIERLVSIQILDK